MSAIDEARTLLANIAPLLDEVSEKIDEKNSELQAAIESLNNHIAESERKKKALKDEIATLQAEKDNINDLLAPLRTEVIKLQNDIDGLVSSKGELQLETFRLNQKNDDIRKYEDKAWKILKAKENELIAREQLILQRENLRPNNKSLLPSQE